MLCFVEFDTKIAEKVLALGVDKSLFVLENPAFAVVMEEIRSLRILLHWP